MHEEWEEVNLFWLVTVGLDPCSWSSFPLQMHQGQPCVRVPCHFCAFRPLTHLNKNTARENDSTLRRGGKKPFQNNLFIGALHDRFSAHSVGLNKLMALGKGGRGCLLKGTGNPFLSWDPRMRLYPRDLKSPHLALKKKAALGC